MLRIPAILSGRPFYGRLLPITRPKLPPYAELSADVQEIMGTGQLTKGKHLERFEAAVAERLGVEHAVAVSSCTVGLFLTYIGVGLSGEVLVPSFTFMATVSALVLAGLKPVFTDVDLETANIRVDDLESRITTETSAIVAVHNFGNPADISALERLTSKHGLKLIFDAAHGFGSLYKGEPVGKQGDAHVFSLSPTKLVIAGEGGIVATNDEELADKIRTGREYGHKSNYDSLFAGLNGRMPEFNAILGLKSLEMLEEAVTHRNKIAGSFKAKLGGLPGIAFQEINEADRSSFKDFSIRVRPKEFGLTRDQLAEALRAENIDSRNYYDPPVHRQTAYRRFSAGGPLTNTEVLSRSCISIPLWSDMPEEIAEGICAAIGSIYEHREKIALKISKNAE
jgi:dTDP-4-amino-4,6-dideoxygalactose transaminase